MRPVVDLGPRALRRETPHHDVWQPEQLERLIDEMGTEIVPQTRSCTGPFAPSVSHVGPVAVEMRFDMGDVAECPACEETGERDKVAIPPPALKYGQYALGAFRERGEPACILERRRDRLLDHHVLARTERRSGQRHV